MVKCIYNILWYVLEMCVVNQWTIIAINFPNDIQLITAENHNAELWFNTINMHLI